MHKHGLVCSKKQSKSNAGNKRRKQQKIWIGDPQVRGKRMTDTFKIEPHGVYGDGDLVLSLGLSHASLVAARRSGELQYRRIGKRTIYLGEWILDWLTRESAGRGEVTR